MSFIETVAPEEAQEPVAGHYREAEATFGYLPNFARGFSLRPDAYAAWMQLVSAVRDPMDRRRYELATLAAARALRSSYCMLGHGTVLAERFMDPDDVRAVAEDHRRAGLDEVDVAVMDFAEKVATDASAVTQADVDRLRELGLTDTDVLDLVLTAAARAFFTKVLDATGAAPDRAFADLDERLRDALVVGRPISPR